VCAASGTIDYPNVIVKISKALSTFLLFLPLSFLSVNCPARGVGAWFGLYVGIANTRGKTSALQMRTRGVGKWWGQAKGEMSAIIFMITCCWPQGK